MVNHLTSGCTGQISAVTFCAKYAQKPPSKICSASRALDVSGTGGLVRTDVKIDVVVLAEKSTGKTKVVFESNFAPADQAMDLFASQPGKSFALYHQDAYYDKTLESRRKTNNMLMPGQPTERLILVAGVLGGPSYNQNEYIELSRCTMNLKNVPIDEK